MNRPILARLSILALICAGPAAMASDAATYTKKAPGPPNGPTPMPKVKGQQDPNALFGVSKDGYFENSGKMSELQTKNPALYTKLRQKADQVKKQVEEAQAQAKRDGKPFTGIKPTGEQKQISDQLQALKGGKRRDPAEASKEPSISGDGIPKEIMFKGKPEAK